ALPLGVSEGKVLRAPDDQHGSVRKLGQATADVLEVGGCSDELPGGNHCRSASGPASPRREVHGKNFPIMVLGEAAREKVLRDKVECRRERASDWPAHHPAEDANPPFVIEGPRKRVADD